MKIVISTIGRSHSFDMARQFEKRDAFEAIFSGYPTFKLRNEGLRPDKVHTYPYLQTPYIFLARYNPPRKFMKNLSWAAAETLDKHVAKNLPECDAFVALSRSGLQTARVAKARGAVYMCDRGSAHIAVQSDLLVQEHELYGIDYPGVDPRVIAKEEAEYELADAIITPSKFALKTFLERGVPESKLAYAPYGVDLGHFVPRGNPETDGFEVLFVGNDFIRKGIRYLIPAFRNVTHPRKHLTLAGSVDPRIRPWLEKEISDLPVDVLGPVSQSVLKDRMSRAHVLVLPSVEDGWGIVMSEAMACGCPIVASDHTGAPDLLTHGVDGYVFPSGDIDSLTQYLQLIADDPSLRARLSAAAMTRVASAGGWDEFGEAVYNRIARLSAHN